ncbi:MAG TPA: lysylphosphatidylglycerol synthase transmembrane domain-containing protein [Longimicrobiaceae bacterium]|jgi:uncharacterized protein (TIRG00374 family)|nr:lysylphosphatidylglycerol synthase transmembrane domain-containing protein [Longimicrobiaceae bacterium]
MTPRLGKALRWGVLLAIAALLAVFARGVDWPAVGRAMRSASVPLLLAATAVNLVSLLAKGVRWWLFLRRGGVSSLGVVLRATVAGSGLNNVLPANAGEAARVVFVARSESVPAADVLAGLALERSFDVIGFVLLLVGAAAFVDVPPMLARWRLPAIGVLAALMLLLLLVARRQAPAEAAELAADAGLTLRVRAFIVRTVASMTHAASPGALAGALLLSLVAWGLQLATYHLAAMALHFPITLGGTVTVLLAANLGFAVRTTPGGVGVFQLIYAVVAVRLGLPREAAISVALLLQMLQILPVTLLGAALAPRMMWKAKGARDI